MLNNITIGKYYAIDSPIHRVHSFLKLIIVLCFVILLFVIRDSWILVTIGFYICLYLACTNIPFKHYWKQVWGLKYFLLGIALMNILCGVSYIQVLHMTVQIVYIVWMTTAFLYTTSVQEIISALSLLLSPLRMFKIPTHKLAYSIGLSIHFIPIILEKTNQVLKSLVARGVWYTSANWKQKFALMKSILLPIVDTAIRRADQIAELMELRLYNLNNNYVMIQKKKFQKIDILYLCIHMVLYIWIWKEVIV